MRKKVGFRLRSVTQKRNQGRFRVTHGYVSWLRSPIPGYVWLRKSVTQAGSRLRMVTQVGYAARFLITHGYVSWLHTPVPGYVSRLHNPVPGYPW